MVSKCAIIKRVAIDTKVTIKMAEGMVKERIFGQMEISILAFGVTD